MIKSLAIFSPSKNAYSETFIQAHRKLNEGNIVFYFGSITKLYIDGEGRIISPFFKGILRLYGKLFLKDNFFDVTYSIKKSLKKHNITKILIEYGTFAADLLPFLKKSGIPFIVHFHGYDASSYKVLRNYNLQYKELFNSAKYVISVSKSMHEKLLELGCPDEKLVYNTYGPQDFFININPTYKDKIFLSVGRLVEKKAPHLVVLAFESVFLKHPESKLIIVGDGPFYAQLKTLIFEKKMDKSVTLTGRLKPNEIVDLMKDSICYVQHSITAKDGDKEGTPLTILEASAAGLPIVSTNHAGIPDVVLHNETGFLVEEGDVETMGNFLCKIIDNPNEAKLMGENGKKRIKEHFSLTRHLNVLNNLFNQ